MDGRLTVDHLSRAGDTKFTGIQVQAGKVLGMEIQEFRTHMEIHGN